nr:uncharacterized protein LOC127321271 isoform X2 [Lolium perenne]
MPRDCYSEFLVPNLSAALAMRDSSVSPADGVPALMAGSVARVAPWWRVSATPSTSHVAAANLPCYLAMRQYTALVRPGKQTEKGIVCVDDTSFSQLHRTHRR